MSQVTQAAPSDSAVIQPEGPGAVGVEDAQVVAWLLTHPEFFDVHADLLAEVRIRQPNHKRTISLVERQVQVLRERNKALEARMAELIRIGQENDAIGFRLQALTQDLLRAGDPAQLPAVLLESLRAGFGVPQVALRLWGIQGVGSPFGDAASAALRRWTDELRQPYCGPNSHPEPARWLPGAGEATASVALLALRAAPTEGPVTVAQAGGAQAAGAPGALARGAGAQGAGAQAAGAGANAFGLLVLGSDDAGRFQAGMGTAFLERIAAIASASLSRLLP